MAVPLDPIYPGTKYALEGVSEYVRYELGQFNIKIILIEPGAGRIKILEQYKDSKKNLITPIRHIEKL